MRLKKKKIYKTEVSVVRQSGKSTMYHLAQFCRQLDIMRSLFAQQDHMQVFSFVLDCLDYLKV